MSTTTSSQRERNFDDLLLLLQGALRAHLARPRDRAPLRQALKLLAEIDLRLGPSGPRDVAALCQEMVRLVAGLAQGLITPSQEGAYLLARAALEIPSQSEMDGDHHGRPLQLLTRELQALREDHGRTRSVASPPSLQNDPARSPSGHTFRRSGEDVVHKANVDPLDGNPVTRTSVAGTGSQSPRVAVIESSAPEIGTATAPTSRKSNPEPRKSKERHIHPRLTDYHKVTNLSKETPSPTSRPLLSQGITAAENEWVDALDDARRRFQGALLLVCRAPDARAAAGQLVAISAEIAATLPGTGCGSLFDSTKRLAADLVRTGAEPSPTAKRLLGRVDRQLGQCLRSFRQLSEHSEKSARSAAWKVPADLIIAVRDAVAAPGNIATAWSSSSGPSNPVSDHTRNQSTNREQSNASRPRPNSLYNHGVKDNYSCRLYEQKPGIPERSGRPQAAPRPTVASKPERHACRQPHPLAGALRAAGDVVSWLGPVIFLLVLAPFRLLVFSAGLLAYLLKGLIITGQLIVQGIGEILYLTATSIVRVIIWTTSGIADGVIAAARSIARGVSASLRALAHTIAFVARGTAHGCVATAFGIAWIFGTAAREIAFAVAATALAIIAPIAAVGRSIGRGLVISGRHVSHVARFLKSVTDEALLASGRWIFRSSLRTARSVVDAARITKSKLDRSLCTASRFAGASRQAVFSKAAAITRTTAAGAARTATGLAACFRNLPTLPHRFAASASDRFATLAATLVLRLWAGGDSAVSPHVGSNAQHHGLRLSAFLRLVFLAPGKLVTISVHQLTRLLKTDQSDPASSRRDTGSAYTLPRPALALAFLGGLGISALTVSNVLNEPEVVDSIAQPGGGSVSLDDRMARCDVPGQYREPVPRPSTHSAHECPPSAERPATEDFNHRPIQIASHSGNGKPTRVGESTYDGLARSLKTSASNTPPKPASLPELDASTGSVAITQAWQAIHDGNGHAPDWVFNLFEARDAASSDNGTGLASFLGLDDHLETSVATATSPGAQEHGGLPGDDQPASHPAAEPGSTNTLASLTGLDGEFGKELAAKARQVLRDHRYLTLRDSPDPDATPENTPPAIRLASLLGPDSDLASALIAAASATPAKREITIAVSDASRLQHSHPTSADDEAVQLSPTRVSDSAPDSNIVLAVWEPSIEHTTAARSRTRSQPETRRATAAIDSASLVPVSLPQPAHDNASRKPTTEARLQLVTYSETNASKGRTPNISQALEIASIGPFLPHLDSMTAPAPSLSADDRDLERRIEASLERNQRLLPTSYQLLDLDLDPARPSGLMWNNHTLREGDSLAALWSSVWKLPPAVLYRILADSESALLLNRVHPGQEVAWQTDTNGELVRLRLWHDRVSGTEWILSDGAQSFVRNDVMKKREVQHIALTAQVDEDIATSLAARPELSASATRSLTILLERHLPMHDDKVQPGDRFALLIEQEMIEGDDTPYEVRLLAFDYRGEKIDLTAIRNTDGRFYTPDGKSLLPAFERTPFVGSYRVSSAYNLRRRHPVTGRTAPHHGTDFSMPVGTPIMAPADGKVTHVHTHPHAGRYLVIEHGQGYTTRYLHLQRTFVRSGQTVKRGERIALSGNTGRTTGPHLHYELHVDGVPVDAIRAELPAAKSLAGIHLEQFQNNAQPLLAALRNADPSQQLAMRPFPGLDR